MRAKVFVLVISFVAMLGSPVSQATHACADPHAGGEWPTYGGDLRNSRSQPLETTINAQNAIQLEPDWTLAASDFGNAANFSNTPIVSGGCLYLANESGLVIAANADTGQFIWKSVPNFPGLINTGAGSLLGGIIVGSPAVTADLVIVGVNAVNTAVPPKRHPYVAAFEKHTGDLVWRTIVSTWGEDVLVAGPVLYDNLIFMGISGNEGTSTARGAYAILDAATGTVLKHRFVIPDDDYAAGYRGASIWCTAAVDTATGHAYACGGNPASKRIEHRYSNAMLKIDLNCNPDVNGACTNPTFGEIVDSYKGNVDQYYPGLDRQPVCDALGTTLVVVWSLACLQLDLDFGSSPSLFTVSGKTMVGNLQKSGVYHALFADHMSQAWTAIVGAPCVSCNAGSPAVDASGVYAVGAPVGAMVSLTRDSGRYRWASPTPAGHGHFQPISVANGVAYTVSNGGILHGYDTSTGLPVLARPLQVDTVPTVALSSNGVAIARNTVYVAFEEFIIAFRLP